MRGTYAFLADSNSDCTEMQMYASLIVYNEKPLLACILTAYTQNVFNNYYLILPKTFSRGISNKAGRRGVICTFSCFHLFYDWSYFKHQSHLETRVALRKGFFFSHLDYREQLSASKF